jgi:hypothetical protein
MEQAKLQRYDAFQYLESIDINNIDKKDRESVKKIQKALVDM